SLKSRPWAAFFICQSPNASHNIAHNFAKITQDYYCDTLLRFRFLDETPSWVHMTAQFRTIQRNSRNERAAYTL
ncbi:MAG TPA: hypothetical protein VN150_00760, partial [Ochrobactrum sp.]|nr:hypothetical protein [Ochrobactrum sp.]